MTRIYELQKVIKAIWFCALIFAFCSSSLARGELLTGANFTGNITAISASNIINYEQGEEADPQATKSSSSKLILINQPNLITRYKRVQFFREMFSMPPDDIPIKLPGNLLMEGQGDITDLEVIGETSREGVKIKAAISEQQVAIESLQTK